MSFGNRVLRGVTGAVGLLLFAPLTLRAQVCETCDDENVCTDDACVSGVCQYTNNTVPCDDGNACTTNDRCSAGACTGGAPLNCDDGNVCTNDTCNPATGCAHAPNTASCNDGNACTTNDTCSGGSCVGGAALVCNDNNACTDDTCTPATGCVYTNDDTNSCIDSDLCNGTETCLTGVCLAGTALVCNDNNACTDDGCNPATGCVYTNNDANSCSDANTCTTNDTCSAGSCVGGAALNCDDGNVCTDDGCNPVDGCSHTNNTSGCTLDSLCSTDDVCSGGICVGGLPTDCDDGNMCTDDACNPLTGCVHVNNNDPCNDGDHCTAVDACMNGTCVEDVAAATDPYRCVHLEWRLGGPASYNVNDEVELSLYAVANSCNTPTADCGATGHPVAEVSVILNWDPDVLELRTPSMGNPNPVDPCDDADCQLVCPANEANWKDSLFPNDCGIGYDGVNFPCTGFPRNDGHALYAALPFTTCAGAPARNACATTSGLHVTTFRFRITGVPPDGLTYVSLSPCAGEVTKTKVKSAIAPPAGYDSRDVTNRLGPAAKIHFRTCNVAVDCDDSNPSTGESCAEGYCVQSEGPCDDGIGCTVDVINEVTGACRHDATNSLCDSTASYCEARICVPPTCPAGRCVPAVSGCVFDNVCISANGSPCPDSATCDESTDTCGGCFQPSMVAAGTRYLAVTPTSQGSTPVALLVTGDCGDPSATCVSQYVQSKCDGGPNHGQNCNTDVDCPRRCAGGLNHGAVCVSNSDCILGDCAGRCDAGTLGSTPYYKLTSQWSTAKVRGAQIRPESTYMVHTECDFGNGAVLSSAAIATTWIWGDIDHNGMVNAIDVTNLVTAFKGSFGPFTFEQLNIFGCVPDGVLNALDIALGVEAVKGFAYPCSVTCP